MIQTTKGLHRTEIHGLCANCNNLETCLNFRARGSVLFCNEHDTLVPVASSSAQSVAPSHLPAHPRSVASNRFKGLCVDCESRMTCQFSNSEAGVWHCEEYR